MSDVAKRLFEKLVEMTRTDPSRAEQALVVNEIDGRPLGVIFFPWTMQYRALDDTIINQWMYWAVYHQRQCHSILFMTRRHGTLTFCPETCHKKRTALHWMFIYGMDMDMLLLDSPFRSVYSSDPEAVVFSTMYDAFGYTPFMYSSLLDDIRHDFPIEILAITSKHLEESLLPRYRTDVMMVVSQ